MLEKEFFRTLLSKHIELGVKSWPANLSSK